MLVSLEDWRKFIFDVLKTKVVDDSANLLILNEADLQFSITRHLREFHSVKYPDHSWHVHNEFRQKKSGQIATTYPDIQIFRYDEVIVSIELKHSYHKHPNEEKLIQDLHKLSSRAGGRAIKTSILIFTCNLSNSEYNVLMGKLEFEAEKLFQIHSHKPEIICINASMESLLDFDWIEKYNSSIQRWSRYGT